MEVILMEATRMITIVEELTEKVEILVGAGCADSLQFRHSQIDKVFEELCSLPKGNHWRFL
jgi:hypothetical protein